MNGQRISTVLFLIFFAVALNAQQQSLRTKTVSYMSGKDTVQAFLCLPEGKGPFPAVILIHEWWGMNDWIKENAKGFARKGYAALAIDLYRGRVATMPDEAHELMRGLPEDRALRDLKSAFQFVKSHNEINSKKIGVIGWCMGGGYSLMSAVNIPELAASVICYGRLVTDSAQISAITCPVLGIFGEADRGIDPKDVRTFEKDARALGKSVRMVLYPNARHAFMNPKNDAGYAVEAASDAWKQIYTFIDSTLSK